MDAVSGTPRDVRRYLGQHLRTDCHRNAVSALQRKNQQDVEEAREEVTCEGVKLNLDCEEQGAASKLHAMVHHVQVWMSWQKKDNTLQKHSYTLTKDCVIIRHSECKSTVLVAAGAEKICENCSKLTDGLSIRRMVHKFALKKYAAERLHAVLFHSDETVKEGEARLKADPIYDFFRTSFDRIIAYNVMNLKNWVRSSFLSLGEERRSQAMQNFMDSFVVPCVQVNVHAALEARPQLLRVQTMFETALEQRSTSDMERINLEIAKCSVEGRLAQHPLLQGLILSCIKMLEREEKGLSMTGRNASTSIHANDEVKALVQEAGCTLAILGCNAELLKRFGQSRAVKKTLKDMTEKGLPTPMLALSEESKIRDNVTLIDERLSATTGKSGCDLAAGQVADVGLMLDDVG